MARNGVRVDGLRQTTRALERLGIEVADLKESMQRIGSKVVSDAQSSAPERTGALKASIRQSKAKNKIDVLAGRAKTYYASFVEYGAVNNKPVEMVTKAVSGNTAYIINQLEREIETLAARVNRT